MQGVLITPVDGARRAAGPAAAARHPGGAGRPPVAVRAASARWPSTTCSAATSRSSHLLERGPRAASPSSAARSAIRQVADRLEGALRALQRAGRPPRRPAGDRDRRAQRRRRAARPARRSPAMPAGHRPTAVFCANDLLALGLLQEMTRHGIRVPDDVAIVGYDDIEFAAAAAVPLSSVRQPRQQLGRTAAELLLEEARGADGHQHRQVIFQPELEVRRSSQSGSRARRGAAPSGTRRERSADADRAVRDLPGRHAVPRRRQGHRRRCWSGSATRSCSRGRRPAAARCTSTPATSARRCRWSASTSRRFDAATTSMVAPSGSCVGSIRHQHAMVARRAGDDALADARRGAWPPARYELSRVPGRRARGRPTSAPTTRTGSPTTRPATRCGCCGSATGRCGCCAQVRGPGPGRAARRRRRAAGSAARSRSRTPTPRRRCWPTRCATCSTPGPRSARPATRSCLMHIGGGLSRLRAGVRTVHLAEILASTRDGGPAA